MNPIQLQSRFNTYSNYMQHGPQRAHHLGLPIWMKSDEFESTISLFKSKHSNTNLFFYIHLDTTLKISIYLSQNFEFNNKDVHILPKAGLNYHQFKDELWNLHLEGYHIYFHHTNEMKMFAKNTELFQKLANRGVSVGISANWSPTLRGNDIQKIRGLIKDLGVHFFDTKFIEVGSESYTKEQENQQQILQLNI